ncbi:unnamed protein product [Ceratitis capitata]|uniref:(Mediterranean fruit fly) hypothetical protein n=1 Tax=Ceratitis capitata TaxID=7213 RepID=A0A811UFI8_CERCA|nr:unnamed protein product [Ceratitis capitata]
MASANDFSRACDALLEFEELYNNTPSANHSVFSLEIQKEELKALWIKVKETFDGHSRNLSGGESDTSAMLAAKCRYQDCYAAYLTCAALMGETIHNLTFVQQSSSTVNPPVREPETAPRSSINLPPCDTEIFFGDYMAWPSFRDLFTAIYINNSRLTPVEKLYHLNQKTRGEARDIVKKSPLTNDGFATAWQNLSDRYENKRVMVNSQLKTLFNLPTVTVERGTEIKNLQRAVNNCISVLQMYGIEIRNWDAIFVFLVSSRLPDTTLALWEQGIVDKAEIPRWEELDCFLSSRFQTLETVSDIQSTRVSKVGQNRAPVTSYGKKVSSHHTQFSQPVCRLCPDSSHALKACSKFLAMKVDERTKIVRKYNLCMNCLAHSHIARDCKSSFSCFSCHQRHHSLLHRTPTGNKPSTTTSRSQLDSSGNKSTQSPTTSGNIQALFVTNARNIILGTAMVHICYNGVNYEARALLDSGSEGTFITKRLQRRIKIPTQPVDFQISGINATTPANVREAARLVIGSPVNPEIRIEARGLILPQLTGNLPQLTVDQVDLSLLPPINLADANFYKSQQVDLVIGADLYPAIMMGNIQRNVLGSLLAQETVFGWILTGPAPKSPNKWQRPYVFLHTELTSSDLTRFWELEQVPSKKPITPEEAFCEHLYTNTTTKENNGRYVVALPFKQNFPEDVNLGYSRNSAVQQFLRSEAALARRPELKVEYHRVLREYISLGHMKPVASDIEGSMGCYYLPHHAVIKPDSTTTKVRVVFNASSPSSNGVSLNDVLYAGPVLQADLIALLLKWRFFKYVFNADIEKMYRQILLQAADTKFHRIIFRESDEDKLMDYELQTVTFGVNCAPYLAIRTLLQLAEDVSLKYPLASRVLKQHMYVDDVLAGAHDCETAIRTRNELLEALKGAGFPLRKWTSNTKEILADLPKDHLLKEDFLEIDNLSEARMLGIRWNAAHDSFHFNVQDIEIKPSYTKREVLSCVAKLFDPAGWLGPIVVQAKILMQDIWLTKIDWDDSLPRGIYLRWENFLKNYSHISKIRIPRWISFTPWKEIELHGFCDASEKAYAAALYVRVRDRTLDRAPEIHLLVGKTRVAPVKTISLPRLELCGALLLAELINALLPQLDVAQPVVYKWTDSTIVLSWLRKPPCSWTTFIANRVAKIEELVGVTGWNHVDSIDNPADLGSRGVSPQELAVSNIWWNGPDWLKRHPSEWPQKRDDIMDTELEQKIVRTHTARVIHTEDILQRFSDFSRALRVVSRIFQFYNKIHPVIKLTAPDNNPEITSKAINEAKSRLILQTQKRCYHEEYIALAASKPVSTKSSIRTLNPFLDRNGIMRVGGRLAMASLAYNERYPIILPYDCQFSRLLVKFSHLISLHGGNQLMLRLVRSEYWVVRIKGLIKTVINNCKVCLIFRKRTREQLMAALPPERTTLSRPFTNTGVDFTGPFDIKNYTGRACLITKGYVCVFVCFATKAIHLEATSDLSATTFLAAFSRFVARRGCPRNMYSDNGTNFVGASKTLKQEFKQFLSEAVRLTNQSYAHQEISWHFIPPGAPHMGGLWEAGVKSFKIHFRKVATAMRFTMEEFATLLAKIEACLNSRPISPMSENPESMEPLTPGHFLIGSPLLGIAEPETNGNAMSIINRWQKLKALHQGFCQRWKAEYLKELHKRFKWQHPQRNIEVDDLVVVKEDNLPPNEWRLGRVVRVFLGPDHRVRVVEILTTRGLITRPIVKLVMLPAVKPTNVSSTFRELRNGSSQPRQYPEGPTPLSSLQEQPSASILQTDAPDGTNGETPSCPPLPSLCQLPVAASHGQQMSVDKDM